MAWKVLHNKDLGVIEVIETGTMSSDDIRDVTVDAIALSRERGVNRALIDTAGVTRTGSTLDHYELPRIYEEQHLTRGAVIAIVMSSDPQIRNLTRLYETACLNRGWTTKCFDTRDQAIAWLDETS